MRPLRVGSWWTVLRALLPTLVVTGVLAVLANFVLEASVRSNLQGDIWPHDLRSVGLSLLGSVVVWALVGLVHAVVGRLRITVVLVTAATALVALANYEKMRLRREPLYPSDWVFAGDIGFLTDVVGLKVVLLFALGVVVLLALAFAGGAAVMRWTGRGGRQAREQLGPRQRLAVRLTAGVVCLGSLVYVSNFNTPGNVARSAYQAMGADWSRCCQDQNYWQNGFVGGFLYNTDVTAMAKPPGYSAATMARIAEKYSRVAERINQTRDPHALDDVNLVTILSESFSDPMALEGVDTKKDPIPYTRSLAASTTSGWMLAGTVGGGTANMEFEALTGMSMSQFRPQMTTPYQMLVPRYDSFPSAVGWLEQQGHATVAMHPFSTEMYKRQDVYRAFGFDRFLWDTTMQHTAHVEDNPFISDSSAYAEVLDQLESEQRPALVHLVTMQNHIPYPKNYEQVVPVRDSDGERMRKVEQYVRGLTYSDEALRELVDGLRRLPEKTVVVLFGDHLPAILPDSVFDANSDRVMHQTPFLVWANFPGPTEKQPTTSPIYFMDLLLERANATLPPYYALLHEMRQELPAIDAGILVDKDDQTIRGAQLSPRGRRLLRDYRMVQYDLSIGRRYGVEAMFRDPDGGSVAAVDQP